MVAQNRSESQDGHLPSALRTLDNAVRDLIGHRRMIHGTRTVTGPSAYMCLYDAVAGEQANTGNGGGSKSRPPMWTDAWDLKHDIDQTVEAWQPAHDGVPPTVGRIRHIQARKWRPQDVHAIEQIAAAMTSWTHAIDELLNPTRKWTLPSPCPACNRKIVYRRDTAGELVRQPALQIGPDGCRCQACKATWQPDQFVFLARVLGSLPDTVLE